MENNDSINSVDTGESLPTNANDVSTLEVDYSNPSDAQVLAQAMVDAGVWTKEQMTEALVADGVALPDAQPDLTDPFAPASSPNDYKLPSLLPQGVKLDATNAKDVAELDSTIRNWMTTAQLPASIGTSLAAHVDKVGNNWVGLDAGQRDMHIINNQHAFDKHFGDKADEMLAHAQYVRDTVEAKHAGFKQFLINSGAAYDSNFVIQLAMHGARLRSK